MSHWLRAWRHGRRLAAPWAKDLGSGVTAAAVQQVLVAAGAALAAYCVARAVRGATYSQLSVWILVLVVVALPLFRLPWLASAALSSVANRVRVDQAHRVFEAVDGLDPVHLDGRHSGQVTAVATHDLDALSTFWSTTLPGGVGAGTALVVGLGALLVLAWPLGLLALAILALGIGALGTGALGIGALGIGAEAADLRPHADLVEAVQGLRELVTHHAVEQLLDELVPDAPAASRVDGHGLRARTVAALMPVAVLVAGAALATHHHLSATLVLPAVALATLAGRAWPPLADASTALAPFLEAVERIHELADHPVTPRPEHGPTPASTEVAYHQAAARYAPDGPDAVHDLTFTVPAGQTAALVGPSGAGKSTTAKLLLRFLDPDAGSVRIGGVPVGELDEDTLRSTVGYVAQDAHLFNTTIRHNLDLGRPDATDAQLEQAARAALAWEFIAALPGGLDAAIGEQGNRLSGGQRQRLALALSFRGRPTPAGARRTHLAPRRRHRGRPGGGHGPPAPPSHHPGHRPPGHHHGGGRSGHPPRPRSTSRPDPLTTSQAGGEAGSRPVTVARTPPRSVTRPPPGRPRPRRARGPRLRPGPGGCAAWLGSR